MDGRSPNNSYCYGTSDSDNYRNTVNNGNPAPNNTYNNLDASNCEIGVWDPNSCRSTNASNNDRSYQQTYSTGQNAAYTGAASWYANEGQNSNIIGATTAQYGYDSPAVTEPISQGSWADLSYSPSAALSVTGDSYYNSPQLQTNIAPLPPQQTTTSYQGYSRHTPNQNPPLRSDVDDWRKPPPGNHYNPPHENSSHSFQHTSAPTTDWQNFTNPLNEMTEENEDAPETLVSRMQKSSITAQATLEATMNKPTILSKSALEMLHQDLTAAAAPFQSVEKLKELRDRQLGLPSDNGLKSPNIYTQDQETPEKDASTLNVSFSNLSVDAKEFVPKRMKDVKSTKNISTADMSKSPLEDSEMETMAINLIDYCIDQLTCNPASFDVIVPETMSKMSKLKISSSAVSVIADKIYEMCVAEPNFRYLGSQLCDTLSRTSTGLPNFRSTLLKKAQQEFMKMDEALQGSDKKLKRARGFTQFMAELFLSLMSEKVGGKLERIAVLGRGTFGVVRKLIDHPNDDNIQCAIRVLKLTILSLEDTLKDDGKNSIEKIDVILDDLSAYADKAKSGKVPANELTENLLESFVKLRAINWGRVPPEELYPGEGSPPSQHYPTDTPPEPEDDENYFMNEPVFFTPNGVQYTAADAADPDFYDKHLAPYSAQYQAADAHPSNTSNAQLSTGDAFYANPQGSTSSSFPYYSNWSAGDADRFESASGEDDYDAELEAFMRSIGC
ncbi:uncharacterized protein LOC143459363 isoform X2 [Clavelina lepadiformis]|uniref:MIF4G domain-containing protein n=1 Tax=Clavelina lepadiformis TaxID=159417 RepID=A0ABP0FAD0_CLALP